jgi:hypothetical protein
MSPPDSQSTSKAYARVAHAVLDPRDLEASLLLKAAAKKARARPSRAHAHADARET